MALPIEFAAPAQAITTYDFVDIAAGTGVIAFYGGREASGAAVTTNYTLSNVAFYSRPLLTTGTTTETAALTAISNLDFDVKLNRPLNVKGKSVINVPWYGSGGSTSWSGKIAVELRKISGSVNTLLGAASGATVASANTAAETYIDALLLDLSQTHFKKDDIVRLNVTSYGMANGGGTCTIGIAHDPKNRAQATGTADWGITPTQLSLQLPVRIDI